MSRFNEQELADLFYDKLADNDEHEQFEPFMADNMAVVRDERTGKFMIALTSDDTEFVWTLERHEKGKFEVFEDEPTLKIGGAVCE